jgi:Retroviral aspartyl protease
MRDCQRKRTAEEAKNDNKRWPLMNEEDTQKFTHEEMEEPENNMENNKADSSWMVSLIRTTITFIITDTKSSNMGVGSQKIDTKIDVESYKMDDDSRAKERTYKIEGLIDSGASANFLSEKVVKLLKVPVIRGSEDLCFVLANGEKFTIPNLQGHNISFQVMDETLRNNFIILKKPFDEVVLGMPFLMHIQQTTLWTKLFHAKAIKLRLDKNHHLTQSMELRSDIPKQYRQYRHLFDSNIIDVLPPHREWDCRIEYDTSRGPVTSKAYCTTLEEQVALREFLQENLKKGFIRESHSTYASPILFQRKKTEELRM